MVVVVAEGAPPRLPGLTCCRCSDWLVVISLEARAAVVVATVLAGHSLSLATVVLSLAFSSRSVKLCHRPVFAPTRRCCCLAAATRHLPFGPHTPLTGGEKKKKKKGRKSNSQLAKWTTANVN